MTDPRTPYLSLNSFARPGGGRGCDQPGCPGNGDHRAPKAPDRLDEHYWFCREHARAYNAAWDYFKGKSAEEITRFQRNVAGWHRPTWKLGSLGAAESKIDDPFDILKEYNPFKSRVETRRYDPTGATPLSAADRAALARLGLDAQATKDDIKRAYKTLAKQYHPDAGGPNGAGALTAAEEERRIVLFRQTADAYRHLAASWRG